MSFADIDIERLSADDRLSLIELLWDSLDEATVPLTVAQRSLLDERLNELEEDIARGVPLGVPWDEVRRRLGTSRSR